MKKKNNTKGIAIIGTRARGGIRAVIENHIQAGVYEGYKHYFIASHDEVSAIKKIGMAISCMLTLVFLIIQGKVSICHLHGSMKGSIYRKSIYVFLCRLLGCKTIFHLHGSEFAKTYENAGTIYRYLVRFVMNRSNSVFVLSNYWQSYVKSISTNPRIQVINNFPSPEFEKLYDSRNYSRRETTELLFLGYIGQRKGIYDLVEAVELLKKEGIQGFRINVGGNGEIEKLSAIISDYDLNEYFNVIGWVSGNLKFELLKESDLLILPSHNEGLPIAILEALSAGLPIISTNVGGIPDAISDERYGLLVDPGQPRAIANAIKRYLNTDGLRQSIAHSARKLYDSTYSSKSNAERIKTVFERMVKA